VITKEQLKADLRAMGIGPGDTVLIHTSLRAVGTVEGGANGFIDAFREYLRDGLLLIPTHTWDNVTRENPVYDVRSTVPCIGTVPRVAAFRPDGKRSLHPTHSIWAAGKGAAEFIAGEEQARTPGPPGFAWARLGEIGAKTLLIGVEHNRNTFLHAVEELAGIPNRIHPEPFPVTIYDHRGEKITHPFSGHFCTLTRDVSAQYVNFEEAFTRMGVQTFGKLGSATVRVVDAAKCSALVQRICSRADRDVCVEKMEIPPCWYSDIPTQP